ncbi:MAG: hypothetical protein N5P05_000510 [Chroococcopsis gigantea SAG 12.99]|jgi:phospholipid/cholesterol/gamma-HCH transport system substrate-binding protein|nr:MCE family protein [Chlorogloea purpurea SAG 13.99]MDV2998904.1 hypothetical protein [Chroococcopsis gigantea SAG 12.99]
MLGSRAVREGTLGLFALLGLMIFAAGTIWLKGGGLGQGGYEFTVEFPDVGGVQVGAPVRFRGVNVGRVAAFKATSNKVEAVISIAKSDLRLPAQVNIQTNRSGLIGEAAIEISPLTTLSSEESNIEPLGKNCDPKIIICNNDRLEGMAGDQLLATMSRLAEAYSEPEFVDNLKLATKNTARAADRVGRLADDTGVILQTTQKDIRGLTRNFSRTSEAITRTANNASGLVTNLDSTLTGNKAKIERTFDQTSELVANLNALVKNNRDRLDNTLANIDRTSGDLGILSTNLNRTIAKINTSLDNVDTKNISQNLETVLSNAAAITSSLRSVTNNLNDPATIVTLQKTLDSARVTFENTQKITSDVDQLLGDPKTRQNLQRLINGLGNLVSSGEQLQEELRTAYALQTVSQQLASTPTVQPPRPLNPTEKENR